MALQTHSLDDVAKVYDNFFNNFFKDHPSAAEIQAEYFEFRKEILGFAADLGEADFSNYASRKKDFLKAKIQDLRTPLVQVNLTTLQGPALQDRRGYFFDFLRSSSSDKPGLDGFMSTFMYQPLTSLVKGGMMSNLKEFGKSQDSKISKEIKRVGDLDKDLPSRLATTVISNLRRDGKNLARVLDFKSTDHHPMLFVFVSVFVTSFEKAPISIKFLLDYIVDLFNVSHHFSLKTEYFALFNKFSKYLQQLLIDLTAKQFEEDSAFHAHLLSLLMHTLHDEKVYKGIRILFISMVKTLLEYCESTFLVHVLSLKADENPMEAKNAMLDFINDYVSTDRITADNIEVFMPKILKIVNLLGYCINGSFDLTLLNEAAGAVYNVASPYRSTEDNSYILVLPRELKSVVGYNGESQKGLVEIVKGSQPTFGLEDFMSISDKDDLDNDAYTPVGEESASSEVEKEIGDRESLPARFEAISKISP